MDAARFNFELNKPVGDGPKSKSKLQHALQFYEQTGIYPEELDGPEIPEVCEHIWSWFIELNNSRTNGINGPNPITFSEIIAWANLRKSNPSPWEVRVIKQIDEVYLETI